MIAPGNINLQDVIRIRCNRRKVGSPTLNSQPGAHNGDSRKLIPGYSDSNIIFRAPTTGNDANDGLTEGAPKQSKASSDTAAGSTKKIRIIEACTLNESIDKPTEMKRGVIGTISSSLTAPVNTWTQSGTLAGLSSARNGITWVPWLSRWYMVGATSVWYSSDGNTWAEISGLPLTGVSIYADVKRRRIVVAGSDSGQGCVGISDNGSSFTKINTTAVGGAAIAHDIENDILVVTDTQGNVSKSLDGGDTWEIIPKFVDLDTNSIEGVAYGAGVWAFTVNADYIWYSTDLVTFAKSSSAAGSHAFRNIFYSGIAGKFLIADEEPYIGYSTDGASISTTSISSFASNGFAESIEIEKIICVGEQGKIYYSSNGTSWTAVSSTSFSTSDISNAAWSPLLGKFVSSGSSKAAYSTAFANTISAAVAGFTIQAVQYSGTVTAYNCTMRQPGTTAALSLDSCRITESGAHISNNAQAHFGNLIEGDFNITGVPASQNAIAVNCNTITGMLSVFNSSSTTYEQIRDNIIEGGFYANYATIMLSGNLRGTNTNGVLSKSVRYDDPVFVDTTDYKLKRKSQGDSQDSPLVAAASYYVNEQGEQRDIGAWSLDDSALPLEYGHTFFVRKPAGQGLKPKKVPAASADQGIDGTWDGTNEPARASEHLTFTCTSVPRADLVAQDFIESLDDLTCEVTLDPAEAAPTTPIVVNGNHSAGVPVLNIDASTTIKSGMILAISGVAYLILYTIGGASVTQLVLHKPLESSVSDNASITPNDPPGDGDYIFMPQQRETPRQQAQEKDVVLNLTWAFVRQYPQL